VSPIANPWHHSVSSAKKHGGEPEDYLDVHAWFDQSKEHFADFRHRALRHHTQGIFECERTFGPTIELSICKRCGLGPLSMIHDEEGEVIIGRHEFDAKVVPTRWIGEQHVEEDLGRIPSLGDWLEAIQPLPWMNRSRRLSIEQDRESRILEEETT
jgi:hypothetical protein